MTQKWVLTEADTTWSSYRLSGRLAGFINLLTDFMFYIWFVSVTQVALIRIILRLKLRWGTESNSRNMVPLSNFYTYQFLHFIGWWRTLLSAPRCSLVLFSLHWLVLICLNYYSTWWGNHSVICVCFLVILSNKKWKVFFGLKKSSYYTKTYKTAQFVLFLIRILRTNTKTNQWKA